MRVVIVGLGIQGNKRRLVASDDYIASVDSVNLSADYKTVYDAPLNDFDAALICTPDEPKIEIIKYMLENNKHVLVEKPLWAKSEAEIKAIQQLAQDKNLLVYTAYNHRFEPHFSRMRNLIRDGLLGKIYHCRIFYGNGTARLVRNSAWRDQGMGVLSDLGSHLLDTVHFWFGIQSDEFSIVSSNCFENRSPDHVIISNTVVSPKIELEMTLLSWRNHFTCDIFAEKGSAHIHSLCKWGPSQFVHRVRQFPSGIPHEETITLVQPDPTWKLEYFHFKNLCKEGAKTDLSKDILINRVFEKLGKSLIAEEICCNQ